MKADFKRLFIFLVKLLLQIFVVLECLTGLS